MNSQKIYLIYLKKINVSKFKTSRFYCRRNCNCWTNTHDCRVYTNSNKAPTETAKGRLLHASWAQVICGSYSRGVIRTCCINSRTADKLRILTCRLVCISSVWPYVDLQDNFNVIQRVLSAVVKHTSHCGKIKTWCVETRRPIKVVNQMTESRPTSVSNKSWDPLHKDTDSLDRSNEIKSLGTRQNFGIWRETILGVLQHALNVGFPPKRKIHMTILYKPEYTNDGQSFLHGNTSLHEQHSPSTITHLARIPWGTN